MKYILLFITFTSLIHAAPARGGDRLYTQENGVVFSGQARGDEHLHWIESQDGEILKYNPTSKNYEMAEIKNDKLAPSGVKYKANIKKARSINLNKLQKEDLYELWQKKQKAHRLKMQGLKN